MWERWDSMLPDGSINPGEMTSFNHYAFGAVADWLHRVVLGIAPRGYRATPRCSSRRSPAAGSPGPAGSLRTPQGEVSVAWRIEDGTTVLDLTVPEGVPALVRMPGVATARVEDGGTHRFTW